MIYTVYKNVTETFHIEVEADSLEEANRILESGELDSSDWDLVEGSVDTYNDTDETVEGPHED